MTNSEPLRSESQDRAETAVENYDFIKILKAHPIYKRYEDAHAKHLELNGTARVDEKIWPQLTGETLIGNDKINYRGESMYMVDDKFFHSKTDFDQLESSDNNKSYTFFHLGHKLTGHKRIIHGGLLATLLDELTCRVAFQNNESGLGVTANLNVSYKQPCFADSYVLIKCEMLRKSGRKTVVKGSVFKVDLDSNSEVEVETTKNLLTECECLVIEPRWVKELGR